MSLVGNLEDLSLPDILQIVSLSRKSGILMIEREGQQGKIIIRQGKVIQTISPRTGKTLGELLTARGLVRPDDLKKALEIQRSGTSRELLGAILVQLRLIDLPSLEKVVQEQIEDAIVFFLTWREGTFSFELADIQGRGEFSVDPQAFILERGIDTQWLVLEGTRLIDERSRSRGPATAVAAAPVEPAGETSFAELDGEPPTVDNRRVLIVVDDDPLFRELAGDQLGRLGFRVIACENSAACLTAIDQESGRGVPPAVAADIVMPTLDNQGFLGGLELLEKLRRSHPEVQVVAVTAYLDENVRAQVLELGGQFLLKPSGGDPEGPATFFSNLAAILKGGIVVMAQPPALTAPAAATAPVALSEPSVTAAPDTVPEPSLVSAPAVQLEPPAAFASSVTPSPAVEPEPSASPAPPVVFEFPDVPATPALPVPEPVQAAAPARSERERALEALAATRDALAEQESALADANLAPAEMELLRDMLEELQSPRAASEIGLLILRFAAELLNRAVLFVVKGGKAIGLGGFGVEVSGGQERRGIRGIAIPLTEPSVLEAVVRRRVAVQGPLDASAWNRTLIDQLGGTTPAEAVALPLISGGRVRVILYGDNLPEARPIAGILALEHFLARAGLTLEKVLLENKIKEADTAAAASPERREQHVGGGSR